MIDLLHGNDCKIIPVNWCVTRFHTISLGGWKEITLHANDETFIEMCDMSSLMAKTFIDFFKETHAFSEPQIIFKPPETFVIKFGMMDIEEFNDRNEG